MSLKKMVTNLIATMLFITIPSMAEGSNIIPMSISDAIPIVNGGEMTFTSETNENWYTFEMSYNGNLLISGSDQTGSYIDTVYIYDESLNRVFARNVVSETIDLPKGKYYIQIDDYYAGSFSVFSPLLNPDPELPTPIEQTIIVPIIMYILN